MKIALIHMRHAKTGGTELFLNHLSRYLAEQGEEVTIICRSHVEPTHPAIKFVKLRPFGLGKARRMWRFAKAVEQHIETTHYDFVYGLGKTWTHDMLRIGGGTHLHFLKASGRKHLRWKDKVSLKIEQKAMAPGAYKHIVANSYKSADEISEAYRVPREKISVIHNFVDTQRFDASKIKQEINELKQKLALDFSKPTFIFLGTGYERKGLKNALQALAKLDFPANLLIAGRESDEEAYKQYAKKLGVYGQCTFLGETNQPEHYFALADCYLLPAHYEPFGFTVIEALSCGTPVIVTENCGAKEVLKPNVSSVISSNNLVDELAEAMSYWAKRRGNEKTQRECRELALTLDVDAIMERNYQQIISIAKNRKTQDPLTHTN